MKMNLAKATLILILKIMKMMWTWSLGLLNRRTGVQKAEDDDRDALTKNKGYSDIYM